MMRTSLWIAVVWGASVVASLPTQAQTVGQPAPAFTVSDTGGKKVSLADYQGRYVVLEWTNPDCPFVQKHYDSGNMPATQKDAVTKGAAWLTVQTAPASAAELTGWQKRKGAVPSATLLDADGKLARAYRAKTTPHLYIVNPQGTLVYAGAIDSQPTANPTDVKGATNYVKVALGEAMAGKPVSQPTTQAYGCSVKYPSGA